MEKVRGNLCGEVINLFLCLKIELYTLRMEARGNLHDHINEFNQLVCQLLNIGEKLSDEEQVITLLASLP